MPIYYKIIKTKKNRVRETLVMIVKIFINNDINKEL